MKYVSLFAGIGGFDLALNRAGHKCVYVNEWDKYSAQTYEKNFGKIQIGESLQPERNGAKLASQSGRHSREISVDTRDITTVPTSEIPDHDLLVGGFPCQSFSIAGKRKGFDDTRGTLFFDIARILKDKRPRYFILENVKGLLSHDEGKTFQTILGVLSDLGYEYQWQVLNSKNFGVPQNRERIFIVGHIRGQPRPKVFPIGQSNGENTMVNQGESGGSEIAQSITSSYWKGGKGSNIVQRMPLKFLQRNQKNIEGDYSFTVDGANTGGVMISKTIRSGGRKSPHGSKQNWDSYEVEGKIRRLSPLECERLQGFPDNWTEGVSDTQRYKQLGNAVTVNVVEAIVANIGT